MKILFVCFPYSVHAARYIGLLKGQGWDIHVFPAQGFDALHEHFSDVTYWPATADLFSVPSGRRVQVERESKAYRERAAQPEQPLSEYLTAVLREGDFDVLHSMEFQHASYLAHSAISQVEPRPIWIATNYGSDIFLYGSKPEHEPRIRELLTDCDYYAAECRRDVPLARELGFSGRLFSLVPNSGGIDLTQAAACRSRGPTSQRKAVALKGYQHFAGRALTVLEAIDRSPAPLAGFELNIYAPSPEVAARGHALGERHGLQVVVWPEQAPHEDILRLHGRSRVSIGNSLSDGISTSFLEAMAMGSFPIQSATACANEWVVDGQGGILTQPDDVDGIAQAISRALTDDELVDRAAQINGVNISQRADSQKVGRQLIRAYEELSKEVADRRRATRLVARPTKRIENTSPRLTVITPTYNRAEFLAETIESVLSQSFREFVFIILDDGSEDNSSEIVERYSSDGRIRFIRQHNVGEVRTVNRGLAMVETEYFTVVNSDDPLLPDSFKRLIEELDSQPDRLMAYPDWLMTGPDGEVLHTIRLPEYNAETLLTAPWVSLGPGAVFRSEALDHIGLRNPLLRYSADLDYIHRLSLVSAPLPVKEVLATHRTHPSSGIVASKGARMASEVVLLRDIYASHPAAPQSRPAAAMAFVNGRLAGVHSAGSFKTAARLLLRAFLRHPILLLPRAFEELPDLLRQFEGFSDTPRRGVEAGRFIDNAWAAESRVSALTACLRSFLLDPIACLRFLETRGLQDVLQRVRDLPGVTEMLWSAAKARCRELQHFEIARRVQHMALLESAPKTRVEAARLETQARPSRESWTRLGEAQQAAGDVDGAAESFRLARNLSPGEQCAPLLLLEGEAHARAGRLEPAIALMEEFVRLDPSYQTGAYYLASCLAHDGRFRDAQQIFLRPITISLHDQRSTTTEIIDFAIGELTKFRSSDVVLPFERNLGGLSELGPACANIVHVFACDMTYFNLFFEQVVTSCLLNANADIAFHVHLINPDHTVAVRVTGLAERLQTQINYTWEVTDLSGLSAEARRTYLACARFLIAPALRTFYDGLLLITDADQTVVSDLRPLLRYMEERDVGLLYFSEAQFNFFSTISASVFLAHRSDGAHRYLERVAAYIGSLIVGAALHWHLDQAALNVVRLISEDVRVSLLPSSIMESRLPEAEESTAPPPIFWSVTYSVRANEAKLTDPRLTQFSAHSACL